MRTTIRTAIQFWTFFISLVIAQPNPDATVILDDFEDTWGDTPAQNNWGAVRGYLEYGKDKVHKGGGHWYTVNDPLGSVVTDGFNSDTITLNNFEKAIGLESNGNRYLHAWLRTDNSFEDYPYAGLVCPLTGDGCEDDEHNLTGITAIKMKVKGDGYFAFGLLTEDFNHDFYRYCFQTNIDLTGERQDVAVLPSDLRMAPYSPHPRRWNPKKDFIKNILILVKDGDYAEMYLDSIVFEGVKYKDFPVAIQSYRESQKPPISVQGNSISYSLREPSHVRLSIYNLQGKLVETLVNGKVAPGSYKVAWHGKTYGGTLVSNGMYLVRLKTGTQTWTTPFTFIQ